MVTSFKFAAGLPRGHLPMRGTVIMATAAPAYIPDIAIVKCRPRWAGGIQCPRTECAAGRNIPCAMPTANRHTATPSTIVPEFPAGRGVKAEIGTHRAKDRQRMAFPPKRLARYPPGTWGENQANSTTTCELVSRSEYRSAGLSQIQVYSFNSRVP